MNDNADTNVDSYTFGTLTGTSPLTWKTAYISLKHLHQLTLFFQDSNDFFPFAMVLTALKACSGSITMAPGWLSNVTSSLIIALWQPLFETIGPLSTALQTMYTSFENCPQQQCIIFLFAKCYQLKVKDRIMCMCCFSLSPLLYTVDNLQCFVFYTVCMKR